MKKLLIALICVALCAGITACNKKEKAPDVKEPSVKITDEAEKTEEKEAEKENTEEVTETEAFEKAVEEESAERTEESDRTEIANNIRDAKELIAEELYDDAEMIITALESRELTEEEQKEVDELKIILAEAN